MYKLTYDDPSYELLTTNFWSTVEPALLIANSCIPLLRPPLQSIFSRFWAKTRTATQYAFGSVKETVLTSGTRANNKSITGKPPSRVRLSGYASPMGNKSSGNGTQRTTTNVHRSVAIREDDEIEMVPNHPYILGGAPVTRAGSESRTDDSDLEAGVIRVQKDWYVTEEKVVNSNA